MNGVRALIKSTRRRQGQTEVGCQEGEHVLKFIPLLDDTHNARLGNLTVVRRPRHSSVRLSESHSDTLTTQITLRTVPCIFARHWGSGFLAEGGGGTAVRAGVVW